MQLKRENKKQWREDNDINEKQFYYWQRRIRTLIYKERQGTTELSSPVFAEVSFNTEERITCISNDTGLIEAS